MSFSGETYSIPFDRGGLTGDSNVDRVAPEMMIKCKNLNFNNGGRGRRGGTAKLNSSAISGSPVITGGHDYILRSGAQYTVVATSAGNIGTIDSASTFTSLKTGLAATNPTEFVQWNNKLYSTNGTDAPQTWDGSAGSTSTLGNLAADWTGTNQPKKFIVHGYGNSERMWAFGCPSNPNVLYYSDVNDGINDPDFSAGGQIYLETKDGFGLTAGIEFGDRIIMFGKTESFVILDQDASTANWGYNKAQWTGGASSVRLVCKTPNDIIAMMDDGTIYSATSVEAYGDYKRAELSKPAYIDQYIKYNTSLTNIGNFHMIYDPDIRAVRLFIVKSSKSSVEQCLLFFIDRPPAEAWSLHDNESYASGFNAYCSWITKESAGMKCYTGDYSGFVWKLEQTSNKNDGGNGYYAGFKSPPMTFGDGRVSKFYRGGRVIASPTGNFTVSIIPTIDGVSMATQSVTMKGLGGVLGSFVLGTDVLGGSNELIEKEFDIGMDGKRLQLEMYNSTTGQDVFFSQLYLDFKPLAKKVI